jgi:hypothetical protein
MLLGKGLTGTVIADRYVLGEMIGEGGFGVVYAGREEVAGDYIGDVAVKLCAAPDDTTRRGLVREVQAMAQLAHPSLVAYRLCGAVTDGPLEGAFYIVMELAEKSLRTSLTERGAIPEADVRECVASVADGLAHMHQCGAVHRDIKPENILFATGRWKLGDMGLARAVEGELISTASRKIGTLAYMSPEAIDGTINPASDVYALGLTTLECLTGRLPYRGSTATQVMRQIISEGPDIPDNLPPPWGGLVRSTLSSDPTHRPAAAEVAALLAGRPSAPLMAVVASESEGSFHAACEMAMADGVITDAEKDYLRTLVQRLSLSPDVANRIFREVVGHVETKPVGAAIAKDVQFSDSQKAEGTRILRELFDVAEPRAKLALIRNGWNFEAAMAYLERETEGDRRARALFQVCDQAVVSESRAREALEQVGWDAAAAVTFVHAADEKARETARRMAEAHAAERKERMADAAKVAGKVLIGAGAVALVVAGGIGVAGMAGAALARGALRDT